MSETLNPSSLEQLIIQSSERVLEAFLGEKISLLILEDSTTYLTQWAQKQGFKKIFVRNKNFADAERIKNSCSEVIEVAKGETLKDFVLRKNIQAPMVIGRLPKAIKELEAIVEALVQAKARAVVLGGNTKHMTFAQNDTLAKGFDKVSAGRGKGKFRCLEAAGVKEEPLQIKDESSFQVSAYRSEKSLTIHNVAGVFGAKRPDLGGLALADAANAWLAKTIKAPSSAGIEILDLGSGNGLVSILVAQHLTDLHQLALRDREVTTQNTKAHTQNTKAHTQNTKAHPQNTKAHPHNTGRPSFAHLGNWHLVASDIDADAVSSTKLTLKNFDSNVSVHWDDRASKVADLSQDLVLLNPPFHAGSTVDASLVIGLLDAAVRVLKPGAVMMFVHNSHLRYRPLLEQRFERVEQVSRNQKFTVLKALSAKHAGSEDS